MANVITTVLKLNATDLKTGLKSAQQSIQETEGLVGKAKAGFSGLFSAFKESPVAIGAATAAVGTLAVQSVKAASDLEESINAVNVTFGESADKILAFGENAAKSVGLAKAEFNELATPLGSILKNAGFQLDEVADKTITLTQRAADMASVFNTDVSESLNAIQAGLRGEQDPLEWFGVSLSAAKVEARALADTGKDNAKALTDQEKQLARINIILDQTNQTAGDFANTSDGLANQTRILKAEFTNLEAAAGQELIPKLSALAAVLIEAKDAADQLGGAIRHIPGADGGGGSLDFLDVARGTFDPIKQIENINSAWGDLKDSFSSSTDDIKGATGAMAEMRSEADRTAGALDNEGDAVQDLGARWSAASIPLEGASGAMAEMRSHADELADSTKDTGDAAKDAADDWNVFEDGLRKSADTVDFITGKIDELRGVIDLGAELDDISQGFDDIAEAQADLADGGEDAARKFRDQIRGQQNNLLDLLETMKDIPAEKRAKVIAEIAAGTLDSLNQALDDIIGKDRFVHVGLIMPNVQQAFSGLNVSIPNGTLGAPSINLSGVNPQPVDNSRTTIIYPVGSSPTTGFIDQRLYETRNGTNPR